MGAQGGAVWPVRAGVVPSLADGFSPRADAAADLAAALVTGAVVVLVPARIAGERPGGWLESCGKTQLAVCVAESLWQAGRLELLIWVTCTKRASVLSGYTEAAAAVRETDLSGDGESVARRFTRWLGQTSLPWLMVLEDVRDMTALDELWPSGPAGRVLVTTADPAPFSGGQKALIYPVGLYRPAEAQSYLNARLGPDRCSAAAELAADLGYEPLALAQASAVIASSAMSCQDYREQFARKRADAEAASGSPAAGAVTWAISAEHAERLAPGTARALLSLAAFLDGRGIPRAVFGTPAACAHITGGTGGAAADQAGRALRAAQQAGLISVDTAPAVALVRMSQVVQAAVRADLTGEMPGRAAKAAADALLEAWPEDEQPAWLARTCRLSTYSLQWTAADLLWAGGCHPLLLRAGRSLDRTRLTGPAVTYWRELAEVSDRVLGPGNPDTLTARARLYQRTLATRERAQGPEHPDTMATRFELAGACLANGKYRHALSEYRRTLADRERALGPDHLDTITTRAALGSACHAAGRMAAAIQLYEETRAGYERVLGADHQDTLASCVNLAKAYQEVGRVTDALALLRDALARCERVLPPADPVTGRVRQSLAAMAGS